MQLDRQACYRILQARDARYDGRFFICVKTTDIYCRPICPVRPPKFENCFFVASAAAAQEAGFRPCLRCRPECSPDVSAWRGSSASVARALLLIERGALDGSDVDALAARLGLGARQLRRLFRQHLGASPISVAQTRRVLLAKQLIHDSQLSMTEVAVAAGFASLRRFNETFKHMYGRPPSELRKRRSTARLPDCGLELLLPYRAPYDFALMLAFLRGRATPGVEHVSADSYARMIEVDGMVGSLEVSDCAKRCSLRVRVRLDRVIALPSVIARVRHMFDLGADPLLIARAFGRDPVLSKLVAARPGLRVPGAWDGFEIAVRAVLGQQISVPAATRLAGELVQLLADQRAEAAGFGPGLQQAFPRPERFRIDLLQQLRIPRARAAALQAVASALLADPTLLDAAADLDQTVTRLMALPGIGRWSAQYIAMRALRQSDAFPAGDIGLQRALAENGVRPSEKALLARAEAWRPWRSYAVLHLWTADAARARDVSGPANGRKAARGGARNQEQLDALAS